MGGGIAPEAMDKAVEIIEEQLDDVRSGRISDDEMDKTRRAITRDIRMMGTVRALRLITPSSPG